MGQTVLALLEAVATEPLEWFFRESQDNDRDVKVYYCPQCFEESEPGDDGSAITHDASCVRQRANEVLHEYRQAKGV